MLELETFIRESGSLCWDCYRSCSRIQWKYVLLISYWAPWWRHCHSIGVLSDIGGGYDEGPEKRVL